MSLKSVIKQQQYPEFVEHVTSMIDIYEEDNSHNYNKFIRYLETILESPLNDLEMKTIVDIFYDRAVKTGFPKQ